MNADRIKTLLDKKKSLCDCIIVNAQSFSSNIITKEGNAKPEILTHQINGLRISAFRGESQANYIANRILTSVIETGIEKAVRDANKRSSLKKTKEANAFEGHLKVTPKIRPVDISTTEKEEILSLIIKEINGSVHDNLKIHAFYKEVFGHKRIISTEGSDILLEPMAIGLLVTVELRYGGRIVYLGDEIAHCGGYELIRSQKLHMLIQNITEICSNPAELGAVASRKMPVVLDCASSGILFHETIGHFSEADLHILGISPTSYLKSQTLGDTCLTVSDVGVIEGGAWVPFDDEGVPKDETIMLKGGAIYSRLHSRETATMMDEALTGNGRSSSYTHPVLVRQTNTVVKSGNFTLEELFKEVRDGLFIRKGYKGGFDHTGNFYLRARYGQKIKNGELIEEYFPNVEVRGSIVSSFKKLIGLTKNSESSLALFCGCGKMKQSVIAGYKAPATAISEAWVEIAPAPDSIKKNLSNLKTHVGW